MRAGGRQARRPGGWEGRGPGGALPLPPAHTRPPPPARQPQPRTRSHARSAPRPPPAGFRRPGRPPGSRAGRRRASGARSGWAPLPAPQPRPPRFFDFLPPVGPAVRSGRALALSPAPSPSKTPADGRCNFSTFLASTTGSPNPTSPTHFSPLNCTSRYIFLPPLSIPRLKEAFF